MFSAGPAARPSSVPECVRPARGAHDKLAHNQYGITARSESRSGWPTKTTGASGSGKPGRTAGNIRTGISRRSAGRPG